MRKSPDITLDFFPSNMSEHGIKGQWVQKRVWAKTGTLRKAERTLGVQMNYWGTPLDASGKIQALTG